ncbi:MAG: acid--CoA ligase [Gammaproteobacteria bacterium]|nr:acid--CoA ligase [Gammaproteobacteria bacterium]
MSLEFINSDDQLYRPVLAYDWLEYQSDVNPENIAIVDLDSKKSFTYREFNDRATRLANYFRNDLQIKKSDRIAILAKNGNEYLEFYYACNKLGAISVLLNWRLTTSELEFIVNDSDPSLIVYDDEFSEQIDRLVDLCSITEKLRINRGASDNPFEDVLAKASLAPLSDADNPLRLIDVQTIMYTSGTTGKPKGAMITYNMTFFNAVNSGVPNGLSTESANLVILPLFHTAGLNCYMNPAVHAGATNVIIRNFDPEDCLKKITDPMLGISHFLAVPAVYLFMSQCSYFEQASFEHVRHAAVGGAPIPLSTLMTWQEKGLPLKQGFGMTETAPSCLSLPSHKTIEKVGSVGLPLLHCEVRIVDEHGGDVAQGEIGELWVRGPNVCPGYWNRPDANRSSFTNNWFHTGDAARQDSDGYFFIVDRRKDMYISGGENVYPAEIESVIHELADVGEAAVIGVPDEKWGAVGKIFLVLKPGSTLSPGDVLRHCAGKLATFKVPKSVEVIEVLPRNASGKILKRELA